MKRNLWFSPIIGLFTLNFILDFCSLMIPFVAEPENLLVMNNSSASTDGNDVQTNKNILFWEQKHKFNDISFFYQLLFTFILLSLFPPLSSPVHFILFL